MPWPGLQQLSQSFPMDGHGKLGNLDHVCEHLGFHETIEVPVLALPGDSVLFGNHLLHR